LILGVGDVILEAWQDQSGHANQFNSPS